MIVREGEEIETCAQDPILAISVLERHSHSCRCDFSTMNNKEKNLKVQPPKEGIHNLNPERLNNTELHFSFLIVKKNSLNNY